MDRAARLIAIVILALLAAPSEYVRATQGTDWSKPRARSYESTTDVVVAVGVVKGWDDVPSCAGYIVQPDGRREPCFGFSLLKLDVQTCLRGSLSGTQYIEMLVPPQADHGSDQPQVGEIVLVTLQRGAHPVTNWSCGRLRPCSEKPEETLMGFEVFRRLRWAK